MDCPRPVYHVNLRVARSETARRPPAEAVGDHHIEPRGKSAGAAKRMLGTSATLSHFDHLLSSMYLGDADAAA